MTKKVTYLKKETMTPENEYEILVPSERNKTVILC